MNHRIFGLCLALLIAAPAAWAGGCTVTTAAAVCVAAKTTAPYRSVVIKNEGSANVCVTDDGSTPSCGAAGTYTLPAGTDMSWNASNAVWAGPFTAIAASGSQPVTYTAE